MTTKKEKVRQLYVSMIVDGQHPTHGQCVKLFMSVLGLNKSTATNYFYNFKKGIFVLTTKEKTQRPKTKKVLDDNFVQKRYITTLFSKEDRYNPNNFQELDVGDDNEQIDKLINMFC